MKIHEGRFAWLALGVGVLLGLIHFLIGRLLMWQTSSTAYSVSGGVLFGGGVLGLRILVARQLARGRWGWVGLPCVRTRIHKSEQRVPLISNMNIPSKTLVNQIETAIKEAVRPWISEAYWVTHYGAFDIGPKNLVYWICVKLDDQKNRLEMNRELKVRLRGILEELDYPAEARSHVGIGFESQETVDRESHGHWWHHWK